MEKLPSDGKADHKTHDVKIASSYYEDIISGKKKFELRKNDRGYKVGDSLKMLEFKDLFPALLPVLSGNLQCSFVPATGLPPPSNAFASIMRFAAGGFDSAGTICRNVADNIQPLEIKGRIFSFLGFRCLVTAYKYSYLLLTLLFPLPPVHCLSLFPALLPVLSSIAACLSAC